MDSDHRAVEPDHLGTVLACHKAIRFFDGVIDQSLAQLSDHCFELLFPATGVQVGEPALLSIGFQRHGDKVRHFFADVVFHLQIDKFACGGIYYLFCSVLCAISMD
ncbi:MAG: hypothetical protein EHM72_07065 [Calditrichaeota bacterium]|nr:MAG: hypothetical protein EHM72_07065 [Calditrichota bacterium]